MGKGSTSTVPTTQTSTSTVKLPQWIEDYSKQFLGAGTEVAREEYVPYPGPRIAPFTEEQLGAFDLTRANLGSYLPYFQGAGDLYGEGAYTLGASRDVLGGGLGALSGAYGPLSSANLALGSAYGPLSSANLALGSAYGPLSSAGTSYGYGIEALGRAGIPLESAERLLGAAGGTVGGAISGYGAPTRSPFSLLEEGARPWDEATFQQYANPYTRNVIDTAKYETERQYGIDRQRREAEAVQAGAFGGDRASIVESEANRNLQRTLADIETTGLSRAYENAQSIAGADRARALEAGGVSSDVLRQLLEGGATQGELGRGYESLGATYGGLGGAYGDIAGGYGALGGAYGGLGGQYRGLSSGYGDIAGGYGALGGTYGNLGGVYGNLAGGYANTAGGYGGLGGGLASLGIDRSRLGYMDAAGLGATGEQIQGMGQQNLDLAYADFLHQYGLPQQNINWLTSLLQGSPGTRTPTTSTTGTTYNQYQEPSMFGNLFGLGLAGLGTAGSLGWAPFAGAGAGAAGFGGGLTSAGLGALFASSRDIKDELSTADGEKLLNAVRELPITHWRYHPEMGDAAPHVGPYAEDWQRLTGLGDGETISIIDALGVAFATIKELDREVHELRAAYEQVTTPASHEGVT